MAEDLYPPFPYNPPGPVPMEQPTYYPPYWYTQTGAIVAPKPVETAPPVISSPRLLAEHGLMELKAPAERADLADGRRIYRVFEAFVWRLPKDQVGPYIWAGVIKQVGPTGTPVPLKLYWTPISPITDADVIVHDWVRIE